MILRNVPVLAVAAALPIALLVAWLFGSIAQWLLRGRARLGLTTLIVVSLLGTSAGLAIAGLVYPDAPLWGPLTVSLAIGGTLLAVLAYSGVAAHLQRPEPPMPIAELIRVGESDQVEFKSSARWNLRTDQRDDRMELVIAKTIAAFLNSDGGTLVIGVDDQGQALGLSADFATLKQPDPDRFELWLRDLLTTMLGQNAGALPRISFSPVTVVGTDTYLCRVDCPSSPRAVYLRPAKGAAAELWVRSGNSTRLLRLDEAVDYINHRWPPALGTTAAAQLRAAVHFSGQPVADRAIRSR